MNKSNQNIDTILLKSKKLIKDGQKELAKDLLEKFIKKFPNNIRIKNTLLEFNHQSSNKQEYNDYNKLLNFYNQKDYKSALIYGEKSILKFPNDPNINNIYGLAQTKFKNYDLAIRHFKNAIILNPKFSLPYYNIGNTFLKIGNINNAIIYFNKAVEIDSQNYLFFDGLGRAYYSIGEDELCEKAFLKSLSLNKNNSNAYNMLGNLFARLDKFDLAENYLKKAIIVNPNNKDPYYNLGNLYKEKNWLSKSVDLYKKAIKIDTKFIKAYLNLSSVLISLGHNKKSLSILKTALDLEPTYPNIYKNLAINYYELGQYSDAIDFNNHYLDLEPDDKHALFNLSLILSKHSPENIDEKLNSNILKILNTEGICRPNHIIKPVLSSILKNSFFNIHKIIEFEKTSKCEEFISGLIKQKILIKFMEISPIPFLLFENLITSLRKSILINLKSFKNFENLLTFQISLAQHCYVNEYIFSVSEDEKKLIKKLKNLLINSEPKHVYNSESLLCLASYYNINSFKWLEKERICPKIKSDIINYFNDAEKEENILKNIPSLTKTSDKISKVVKKRYEENPYPRWLRTLCVEKPVTIEQLVFDLNLKVKNSTFEKFPEVLIAGCGTGQHAIMSSSRFMRSNVLAIDLSFRSLSYAIRKTNELGIGNIKYMQADINKNFNLKTKFDLIESVGVLHHMDDPVKGWGNLLGLLKDNGLMKVGLYSKTGRQNLKEVKKFILENKITNPINFRNNLLQQDSNFLSYLQNQDEFYSTSQFKDLLFHPKEKCFSISELKNILKTLGLKFCGFENPKFSKELVYLNNTSSLEEWENIEKNNPNLFSGMYQFWVQKL